MAWRRMPCGAIRTAFFLMAWFPAVLWAGTGTDRGPYLQLETFGFSEPLPIKNYAGDFRGRLEGGSDGVLFYDMAMGWREGEWGFALIGRGYWAVDTNRDTVELRSLDKNGLPLPTGRVFDIDIDVAHLEGVGLAISRIFTWRALELRPQVAVIKGYRLTDGTFQGSVVATSPDTFDATFDLDYVYSDDEKFFGRQVSRPTGLGILADIEGRWQIAADWSLRFTIKNLLSRMYWEDAPRTVASGSTANADADSGISDSVPLISGKESFNDFDQRLKPYGLSELAWQSAGNEFSIGAYTLPIGLLPVLGYGANAGELVYGFKWMPGEDAVGIEFAARGFEFSWMADAVSPGRARVFSLQLSYQHRF